MADRGVTPASGRIPVPAWTVSTARLARRHAPAVIACCPGRRDSPGTRTVHDRIHSRDGLGQTCATAVVDSHPGVMPRLASRLRPAAREPHLMPGLYEESDHHPAQGASASGHQDHTHSGPFLPGRATRQSVAWAF